MARKVLGNDPFQKGAAGGDAPAPRPTTPDRPRVKSPRPARGQRAQASAAPRPHPGSPEGQPLGSAPRPHPGSPEGQPLGSAPRPHPGSPEGQPLSSAPRPHPGSPEGQPLGSAPRPHPGSPEGQPLSSAPRPHPGSPEGQPLGSAPRPHPGSPEGQPLSSAPRPHPGSPEGQPLGSAPRPHPGSPEGQPLGNAPRPHAGSPSTQALDDAAHAPGDAQAPRAKAALASPPEAAQPPSFTGALRGLWGAARAAAGLGGSGPDDVDAWGKDAALARQLRPLGELLYTRYWRVSTQGIEHVPPGPCVLVANHAGALPLDGPVLHLALARERPELPSARWLLEDQVFHAPLVGLLANRLGAVRANRDNALRLLAEGRPVIVFPEGFHGLSKPFSERYQLRRFGRGGYLKVALRAHAPVIPVAIVGGEESMPLLAKVPGGLFGVEHLPVTLPPLPARWFIRFGPPVDLSDAPGTPEDDLAWLERTNLAVRDGIERMLGDLLAARPGVF